MKLNPPFFQRTLCIRAAAIMAAVIGLPGLPAMGQCAFRGVWADVYHVGYKNSQQITDMVNRVAAARYNAIIVEVLAWLDNTGGGHGAYWTSRSNLAPRASDIGGGIDPLAVLCQAAHDQGIEVHAWIFPYRTCTSWPPSGNTRIPSNGDWLMVPQAASEGNAIVPLGGGQYWLDFGNPDVQEYLISIVRELVTDYSIDGIHWDYELSGAQSDCGYPANNNAYTQARSGLSRYRRIYNTTGTPANSNVNWSDFRRRAVEELMKRTQVEMASIASNPRQPLRQSVSLMAYGNPPANCTFTGEEAYLYYCDWPKWMQNGWIDTAVPMAYKHEACLDTQYRNWVDRSLACWRYNRHLFMGVGAYMNSFAENVTQMQYACSHGADGVVTYSYVATRADAVCNSDLWANDWSWYTYVAANYFTNSVATPPMSWRNPATATEGAFWGRVTDVNGLPIDDATVTVSGIAKTVKTDGNGYYVATLVPATPAGTNYGLNAGKTGFPSAGASSARVWAAGLSRYDFSLGANPAQIQLSPNTLVRTLTVGASLPDDTFTITKAGQAPLNYIVSSSSGVATVSPLQGTSSGEVDTITITYNTAGLPLGTRNFNITVTDPMASNNPQTIAVTLNIVPQPVPGDFDGDYDVDMDDFGRFQACMTGPGGGIPAGCDQVNFKVDAGIDQQDFAFFMKCFTGPSGSGDPSCLTQ